jgi:hypothetical protein
VVLDYAKHRHLYKQLGPNISVARVKRVCQSLDALQAQVPKLQRVLKSHKEEHAIVRSYSARSDAEIHRLNDWNTLPYEVWEHIIRFCPRFKTLRSVCLLFCNIYANVHFSHVKLPAVVHGTLGKPSVRIKLPRSCKYVFPVFDSQQASYLTSLVRARSHGEIVVHNPFNDSLRALWSLITKMTITGFPARLERGVFRELRELKIAFSGHTTVELPMPPTFKAPNLQAVYVSAKLWSRFLPARKSPASFFRGLSVPVVMTAEFYARISHSCPNSTLLDLWCGPKLIRTAEGAVLQERRIK